MSTPRLFFLYPAFLSSGSRSSAIFLRRLTTAPRGRPPPNATPAFDSSQQVRRVTLSRHGTAVDPNQVNREEKEVELEKEKEASKTMKGTRTTKEKAAMPEGEKGTVDTAVSTEKPVAEVAGGKPVAEVAGEKPETETAEGNSKTADAAKEATATENERNVPAEVQVETQQHELLSVPTPALNAFTETVAKDEEAGITKPPIGQGPVAGKAAGEETGVTVLGSKNTKPAVEKIPKYYHNFDTYTMVKQLVDAGYTYNQAIIGMKLIRGMLSVNLHKAKESFVTKSNVENETYLFRAACSELRTEIQNSRRMALDRTRLERAQLQHDYDQLTQRFSEDLINLKDEVSSLFNDRKMVTRAEQRAMEVKIQELNYKLTIMLNGDLRTEIESLRWTTTRRGLIAIVVLAATMLSFVKVTGAGTHPAPKKEETAEKSTMTNGRDHPQYRDHGTDGRMLETFSTAGTQHSGKSSGDDDGDGSTFVSLG